MGLVVHCATRATRVRAGLRVDETFLLLLAGCLLALGTALAVVLARAPIYAAIALLGHSLSLAGLYAVLGAGFVAVGQIVIYSGAIVVLFLIVVTLLPTPEASRRPGYANDGASSAVMAGAALLAALALALSRGSIPAAGGVPLGGVEAIGLALFGPLLVAFELTAPLLLVAIIGAVAIWRRHEPQTEPKVARAPRAASGRRELVIHR